ncbi:pyruvate dehydrogenase E1 component beta subunit [Hasllibacter halocynthiae]|uniref:Pyruvate dehydrogenase E1 component beta subunit n=1 Tax=Hasllibacter halocynthiae TaxID=595589 RepID=A0A2T0X9W1_9RHOB|nr:transketolase C-terminal domain-containing protein [Hasllibacter halocynthiae]PRY95716.1 pyruvate dehydrogenase E1 component beta subunit [Hasllibacter halocynthiae]
MRMTFQQAVVAAIEDEMEADAGVFVMGQDIGRFGGPLRSNAGLFERFGAERVIDMPMSEGTMAGLAVGAALQGKRPVLDLMFGEFLALVMQQFLDAGAMHYYSGGAARVPFVLRVKYGIGPFHGHAYDHHSWLMGVPGVKIAAPSTPQDAYDTMRAAVRDDNPVLFLEHMALYHAGRAEVERRAPPLPLGPAVRAREGADVTVVASALMTKRALKAAETLDAEGIEAEVIDLRTIAPWDEEAVLASVHRTGRVLLLSEAISTGASINDVAATIAEKAFDALEAPVARLAPPPIPTPFARELERAYLPDETRIAAAARALARWTA